EIAPMKKDRPAPLADNFKSNNSPVADIEISSTLGNQVIADEAVEKPEVRYKPENRGLSKDLNEKEANKVTEEEETDFLISDFSGSARDTLQKEIIASATLSETKKKTATLPAPNYMSNNGAFSNATLNANGVNHYFSWDFADSAEYGRAVAHYDSAAYDSCILTIKRVTELPASYYYEDGLLLKAKALIKQGKKKEAKKVLKSVIALNGARKMEAEGLLNTLK
ncbi:MAG TPA: hypothetical protein VEC12_01190, partial [Bacteroidia bacterium]|nr:hypothetical protein [Bacteroidia bacterium]